MNKEKLITEKNFKSIIKNSHRMLKRKYRNMVFWAFIKDLLGYGSTSSMEICEYFNWNPHEKTDKIDLN